MSLLDELGALCEVREPWPGDLVDGLRPQVVARPASTAETSAVMRFCHERGLAVTVRGGGTKQTWGMPPARLDVILETLRMDQVVEHAHGDLIATVGTGLRLADLDRVLRENGQQLIIDDLVGGSTVGGAVATNQSGPRRMAVGAARDLLIGVTVVRADGTVAKSGGKVVKNVAGYDLCKLLTGSFGTLGVLTEVTFRLHPVTAASQWVSVDVDPGELAGPVERVLHSQLVPTALEVDHAGGTGPVRVAALFTGTEEGVASRVTAARELLGNGAGETDATWTGRFPWLGDDGPGTDVAALKLTCQLSSVPALVQEAARRGVAVRGSAGAGVLYAAAPATDLADTVAGLRGWCLRHGGSLVVLDAPGTDKTTLDVWGSDSVGGLEIMRRVKHEFDPTGVLSVGRFVGGI